MQTEALRMEEEERRDPDEDRLVTWPEKMARIREIRAENPGPITADQLVDLCISEDVFDTDDDEAFIRDGMRREILNACSDMRVKKS